MSADAAAPLTFEHDDLQLTESDTEFVSTADPQTLGVDVVLFVVTAPELEAVLRLLQPLPGRKTVVETVASGQTTYVGLYGVYACAVVQQPAMGSGGVHGAHQVAGAAVRFWKPKAAIMIGIGFGLHPDKQELGDVLVSEKLGAYDLQRVTDDSQKVTHRGTINDAGLRLVPRFVEAATRKWKFVNGANNVAAHVRRGLVLTGQVLVDSAPFAKALLEAYPDAVGGEMEGDGVASACSAEKVEWIIVKGICDFAGLSGKKNKKAQPFAAAAAASLVKYALSKHTLSDLGCTDRTAEPAVAAAALPTAVAAAAVPAPVVAKTFSELRAWIHAELSPEQRADVLMAVGVGSGNAARIGNHGGAAEFWSALSVQVAFEAAAIDETPWQRYPAILRHIQAYKASISK